MQLSVAFRGIFGSEVGRMDLKIISENWSFEFNSRGSFSNTMKCIATCNAANGRRAAIIAHLSSHDVSPLVGVFSNMLNVARKSAWEKWPAHLFENPVMAD